MRRILTALMVSAVTAMAVPAVPVHAGAPAEPITPAQPVAVLTAFAPARVYDTRPTGVTADGQGAALGKLAAGETRMIGLVGRVGIDHESAAVVLNATVTGATAGGTLRMWPCALPKPTATVLSYAAHDTVANTSIIRIASDLLCVSTTTSAHLILDAVDQFNLGSRLLAEQKRLVNTSTGFGGHRLKAATWTPFTLNDRAQETFLNVTAFGATKAGFLSVTSCPANLPLPTGEPGTSAVNYAAGERIANLVAVPSGTRVCAYSSAPVDLYIETVGSLPARFPVPSAGALDTSWRLFDSRWSGSSLQPRRAEGGVGRPGADHCGCGADEHHRAASLRRRLRHRLRVREPVEHVHLELHDRDPRPPQPRAAVARSDGVHPIQRRHGPHRRSRRLVRHGRRVAPCGLRLDQRVQRHGDLF